jgi:hypothetical protein
MNTKYLARPHLILILSLAFALILAACGGETQQPAEQTPDTPVPAATDQPADTAEETEEPPAEEQQEPTETATEADEDEASDEETEASGEAAEPTDEAAEPTDEAAEPTDEAAELSQDAEEPTDEDTDSPDAESATPQEIVNETAGIAVTVPGGWEAQVVDRDIMVEGETGRIFFTISDFTEEDLTEIGIEDTEEITNELILDKLAEQQDLPPISSEYETIIIDGNDALAADIDVSSEEVSGQGRIVISMLADNRMFMMMSLISEADVDEEFYPSLLESIRFMEPVVAEEPTAEMTEEEPPADAEMTEEEATTEASPEEENMSADAQPASPAPAPVDAGNLTVVVGAGENRISVLAGETWIEPQGATQLGSCLVGSVFFDASGNAWVVCGSAIARSSDGGQTWEEIAVDTGESYSYFETSAYNPYENQLWLLEDELITVVDPATASVVASYTSQESTGEEGFPTDLIAFAPDGTIWLGGLNINGSELVSFDGTTWTAYGENEDMGVESYESPEMLYVTAEGELWIFTSSAVYTLQDGTLVEAIPESSATANDIINLPNGEIWIATYGGIKIWDGAAWRDIRTEDGLPSETVRDLDVDTEGNIWAATDYGLAVMNSEGEWSVNVPGRSGIAESRIAALAVSGTPTLPEPSATPKTASVTGRIVYDGEPLADTTVEICAEDGSFIFDETPCEEVMLTESTQTDADGVFLFESLPLATYHLYAINPNATDGPEWVDLTFFNRINALTEGQEIDVGDLEISTDDQQTEDGTTSEPDNE